MKTPYLVQRGEINHPLKPSSEILTQAVRLDYMGSSEFEFGAVRESLEGLRRGKRSLRLVDSITQGDSKLRVLSIFSDEEFPQYVQYLKWMREDNIRLKEWIRFSPSEQHMLKSLKVDFWWDIQNHVIWSFHKRFMKRLESHLQASFMKMDENEEA
jgi:hypothetical protein